MPRSSSSSSRSSPSRSFPSRSKPSYSYSSPKTPIASPSIAATPASVVNHNHQLQQPGFFSNMWQGFGLGAGQSIAMNIFRSDPKVTHVHENVTPTSTVPATSSTESLYSKEFAQCMKDNWDDKEKCKHYIQCLKDNNTKEVCKQYLE